MQLLVSLAWCEKANMESEQKDKVAEVGNDINHFPAVIIPNKIQYLEGYLDGTYAMLYFVVVSFITILIAMRYYHTHMS
jgi:hypothetical protein